MYYMDKYNVHDICVLYILYVLHVLHMLRVLFGFINWLII